MLYLIAGNGVPNYGDELIVMNWLNYYRKIGYQGDIIVDGKGAENTRKLLGSPSRVTFVANNIPRHSDGLQGSYDQFMNIGISFARMNLARFEDAQAFHFLGGGYASANWKNATRILGSVAELGRILQVPVIATGIGIAPFSTMVNADSRAWQHILSQFSMLECRDQNSFTHVIELTDAASWAFSAGLDDAFLAPVETVPHDGRWLHLSGYSESSIFGQSGRALLDSISRSFDKVIFWICSKADRVLLNDLLNTHPYIEGVNLKELLNSGIPVMPEDFMLSARFHPHLMASRVGISGYYSAHSAFYANKHKLVEGLGSSFRRLNKNKIEIFDERSTVMQERDAGRIENKLNIADRISTMIIRNKNSVSGKQSL